MALDALWKEAKQSTDYIHAPHMHNSLPAPFGSHQVTFLSAARLLCVAVHARG